MIVINVGTKKNMPQGRLTHRSFGYCQSYHSDKSQRVRLILHTNGDNSNIYKINKKQHFYRRDFDKLIRLLMKQQIQHFHFGSC